MARVPVQTPWVFDTPCLGDLRNEKVPSLTAILSRDIRGASHQFLCHRREDVVSLRALSESMSSLRIGGWANGSDPPD